jgi:hypothetical protein
MKEILNLKKGKDFTVEGKVYTALTELDLEGYDKETDSYSYTIYAKPKNEYKVFVIKFAEDSRHYTGKRPQFTENDIYYINEEIYNEEDENIQEKVGEK